MEENKPNYSTEHSQQPLGEQQLNTPPIRCLGVTG